MSLAGICVYYITFNKENNNKYMCSLCHFNEFQTEFKLKLYNCTTL